MDYYFNHHMQLQVALLFSFDILACISFCLQGVSTVSSASCCTFCIFGVTCVSFLNQTAVICKYYLALFVF